VILAAFGQAFFATGSASNDHGVRAYAHPARPLQDWVIVSASILLVSLLSTLMIFPMVFHYGMDRRKARSRV